MTTQGIVKRLEREMTNASRGESVTVEVSESGWFVRTTELGMYRIWDAYAASREVQNITKGHSVNLDTWYVEFRPKDWAETLRFITKD